MNRSHIDRLLEQVLELDGEERTAFLARETLPPEERQLLLRLLAASQSATEPELGGEIWRTLAEPVRQPHLPPNTQLGPYRIVSELGRGGMAVVYLAERADGAFEQQVAIKILERPATDELAVRRFHLERQILASLDHPNIARLQDGGIAPDGRPYFVMERVEGLPIDRYCDERQLTVAQRLRLFAAVGKAVAAAHRQLVVHRDLKPSNILVTHEGVPKLLDFGIAKLLEAEPGLAPAPALTRTAMLVMTPEYASPEQLAGLPVTTASDVYQLGLLLYELLAGTRAFQFAGSTPSGLVQRSTDREPTRPSAAVAGEGSAVDAATRASQRGCRSLDQLKKLLVGDLDTIVLAALRPEAERRYESVAAMVADVERTLEGRPILARSPSLTYRLGKFVRRNRWPVAAAVVFLLATVAGITLHTVELTRERDRAERETEKARQVAEFLVELFRASDARLGKRAASTTALELVDRGAKRLESALEDQPEVKASLLYNLGRVYTTLLEYPRAEALLDQAWRLQSQQLGSEAPETLETLEEKANLHYVRDELNASTALLQEVIAGRERVLGPDHPQLASALFQLSQLEVRQGRFEASRAAAERSLLILERQAAPDPQQLWRAHQSMAMALANLGKGEEALVHHAKTLEILHRIDPAHPQLGQGLAQYANQLWGAGRLDESRQVFTEALRVMESIHGTDSPRTSVVRLQAAAAEIEAGQAAAALVMVDHAKTILERELPPTHQWVGNAHNYRGYALSQLGRFAEALVELEKARGILTLTVGVDRSEVLQGDTERVAVLLALGRGEEARALAADLRARLGARINAAPEYAQEVTTRLEKLGL